ncbi:TonB-dependent receptor plug domain-containing protein [Helicobacter himalayensis]|uniref:TonB-dependent receptor plug domain-containing protein n=1 Tax=Helicobacter himalayensis TaxID=1591088 RepID=UPI003D6F9DE4
MLAILCCGESVVQGAQTRTQMRYDTSPSMQETQTNASDAGLPQEKVRLNKVTALESVDVDLQKFQSGESLDRKMLDSNPSGNGDITSILRILPNVQYDTAQLRSATPGEIDPAKISISGGLHYQNLFMVDGMGMNNDLNPAGTANVYGGSPGRSQGFNIDTSLLESIKVQDSNISAAYGGFTGGVIEANTRRPTKDFGANVSYQITQGNAEPGAFSMTNYHLDGGEAQLQNFLNSSSEANQPYFTKHLIRASVESKINERFGVLASFTSTQSIIPMRQHLVTNHSRPTPIDPANYAIAQQEQKRQSYNFFLKTYYDPSDDLRLEFTYTYAPQSDYRFIVGTQDDYYNFKSGGHNASLKAIWQNSLGVLTNTLSYSYMQNSTTTIGWSDFKDWVVSESKHWSNWVGLAREGGYAPFDSTQHTLNNKLIQDFTPFELANTTHTIQLGAELGYQYVQNSNPRDYYLAPRPSAFYMTQSQQTLCLQTGSLWCDTAKVYDAQQYGSAGLGSGDVVENGNVLIWNYGQYFRNTLFYKKGSVALHNVLASVFAEDSINISFGRAGAFNARPGLRVDSDTYMGKVTFAPRLALNYEAPWNEWQSGQNFATQLTFGANRYYGRNIFAYALAEGMSALRTDIRRNDPSISWEEALAGGRPCNNGSTTDYNNCYNSVANSTNFQQLKIPYVNEYIVGFMQRIYAWNLGVKYIYREGKDEIRMGCYDENGQIAARCPSQVTPDGSSFHRYNNEGRSTTNIITLTLQNNTPLVLFNTRHFALLALDWTNVRRNYTDYTDALTNNELANQWISWNGELVRYADKPADNYIRPYTLRLTTTHNFELGRTKWLLNNFFRYRSTYNVMASTPATSTNATRPPDYADLDGDGVAETPLDTFRPFKVKGAFTWDMRVGFEVNVWRGNILYMNFDIYNVLDSKNLAITSARYDTTAGTTATPIYEVGRQFWVQVGYKY